MLGLPFKRFRPSRCAVSLMDVASNAGIICSHFLSVRSICPAASRCQRRWYASCVARETFALCGPFLLWMVLFQHWFSDGCQVFPTCQVSRSKVGGRKANGAMIWTGTRKFTSWPTLRLSLRKWTANVLSCM